MQQAKDATHALLDAYTTRGELPMPDPDIRARRNPRSRSVAQRTQSDPTRPPRGIPQPAEAARLFRSARLSAARRRPLRRWLMGIRNGDRGRIAVRHDARLRPALPALHRPAAQGRRQTTASSSSSPHRPRTTCRCPTRRTRSASWRWRRRWAISSRWIVQTAGLHTSTCRTGALIRWPGWLNLLRISQRPSLKFQSSCRAAYFVYSCPWQPSRFMASWRGPRRRSSAGAAPTRCSS